MATTRKIPTKPEETLPILNDGLVALKGRLTEKEQKENKAFADFNYVNNRLMAASQAYVVTQGAYLLQAKAYSDEYFTDNRLKSTVPTDFATLQVLNVYREYADSWKTVPADKRPRMIPDYAARAASIDAFLKANDFEAKCKAAANPDATTQRRLSR